MEASKRNIFLKINSYTNYIFLLLQMVQLLSSYNPNFLSMKFFSKSHNGQAHCMCTNFKERGPLLGQLNYFVYFAGCIIYFLIPDALYIIIWYA